MVDKNLNQNLKQIDFLKDTSIFKKINEEHYKTISEALTEIYFKSGEIIYLKGDNPDSVYFIIDGIVRLYDGSYTITELKRKQYFGEYSLINSEKRFMSACAITDCSLYEIKKESFKNIVETIPELYQRILQDNISKIKELIIFEEKLTERNLTVQIEKLDIARQLEIIEKERQELMQLNRTKDKFLTIVAHDLKNPFSTIIGISELLITEYDRYDRGQIKVFLEQIHKYSGSAYSLLDNLLQWARSQTGRLKIKKSLYNIKDIVEETIELFQVSFTQKEINVEVDKHPLYMHLDLNMVSTVVRNLVSNAIKFTPKNGKIYINYTDKGDYAHVYVKDSGVGISKEDQEKLFRIDTNPTTIGTQEEKGTGLGLILCSEFVRQHEGTISVDSVVGEGSTFHFTLKK